MVKLFFYDLKNIIWVLINISFLKRHYLKSRYYVYKYNNFERTKFKIYEIGRYFFYIYRIVNIENNRKIYKRYKDNIDYLYFLEYSDIKYLYVRICKYEFLGIFENMSKYTFKNIYLGIFKKKKLNKFKNIYLCDFLYFNIKRFNLKIIKKKVKLKKKKKKNFKINKKWEKKI